MELMGSLPRSQKPAPCAYPQINPVHVPHHTSRRPILILFSHLFLGLPSGLLPSCLPIKILYATLPSPYMLYIPSISFFFIWSPTTFGEEYRSQSSSLCSLLHSPDTACLLYGSEISVDFIGQSYQPTHTVYILLYHGRCPLWDSFKGCTIDLFVSSFGWILPKFKELHANLWGL